MKNRRSYLLTFSLILVLLLFLYGCQTYTSPSGTETTGLSQQVTQTGDAIAGATEKIAPAVGAFLPPPWNEILAIAVPWLLAGWASLRSARLTKGSRAHAKALEKVKSENKEVWTTAIAPELRKAEREAAASSKIKPIMPDKA